MNSILTLINKTSKLFDEQPFIELADKVLGDELANQNGKVEPIPQLCLILSDGDMVKELNRKYRGNDSKTDVLSFTGDYPAIPELGDIVIDIEKANAQKGIMSLNYEVHILFLHGILHLLGYDHITQKQKTDMNSKENLYKKYIKRIGR